MRQSCGSPLRNEGGKATWMKFRDDQAGGGWHSDFCLMASEFSNSGRGTLSHWAGVRCSPTSGGTGGCPEAERPVCVLRGARLAFPGGPAVEAREEGREAAGLGRAGPLPWRLWCGFQGW